MKHVGVDLKWHNHSPVFNIFSLLIGNTPFPFPQWTGRGVNTRGDLYDDDGLRAFNDLRAGYDLPGT